MDEKTRQLYFRFLEFLTETDFDNLEQTHLEAIATSAEHYLMGTELHQDALARIKNAIRFLDASERGAAAFEIKSLLNGIEKRLEQGQGP